MELVQKSWRVQYSTKRVAELADEKIEISEALAGGAAIDRYEYLYQMKTSKAREADAILLGAVGDPKHDQAIQAYVLRKRS